MIQARDLYFSYTGSAPYVLSGIDFEIRDGQYISVVGGNGCGKSTLVRLALRLLKPVRGHIETSAKRTGYVPQRGGGPNPDFPMTVYEMLNSYRKLLKVKDTRAIAESLALVGMSGSENTLIQNLSGGQSQKTLIARALMGSPDLLILDEPSTGIDSDSQQDIYGILKRLNVENGITIVSVEHNLAAAISNSTQIYHLSGGRGHICTPKQYAKELPGADGGTGDA